MLFQNEKALARLMMITVMMSVTMIIPMMMTAIRIGIYQFTQQVHVDGFLDIATDTGINGDAGILQQLFCSSADSSGNDHIYTLLHQHGWQLAMAVLGWVDDFING